MLVCICGPVMLFQSPLPRKQSPRNTTKRNAAKGRKRKATVKESLQVASAKKVKKKKAKRNETKPLSREQQAQADWYFLGRDGLRGNIENGAWPE